MICFLVFLLMVITDYSSSDCPCDNSNPAPLYDVAFPEDIGKSVSKHRRIISGTLAESKQFPWQAMIVYTSKNRKALCGGSLITPRWILTAGHCAIDATHFLIRLGSTRRTGDDKNSITIETNKSIIHENFDEETLNNDISLIDLEKNVPINEYIKPISLPSKGEVLDVDQTVEVSGFGLTNDNTDTPSSRLSYVKVKTITNDVCVKSFGEEIIVDNTICTIGDKKQSTCTGDSGGGLIVRKSNGDATLVAVVSFVSMIGCEKGSPQGYIRTEPYLDWISKHTEIKLD